MRNVVILLVALLLADAVCGDPMPIPWTANHAKKLEDTGIVDRAEPEKHKKAKKAKKGAKKKHKSKSSKKTKSTKSKHSSSSSYSDSSANDDGKDNDTSSGSSNNDNNNDSDSNSNNDSNNDNDSSNNNVSSGSTVDDCSDEDVIAHAPTTYCVEWVPGIGFSQECTSAETADRGGEVCNIVSKAWIRALNMEGRDVDLVINHAGLCQADIIDGPVTKEDVDEFLPKGFKIVLVAMSGKDIELALQQGAKAAFNGNPKSYPYGSGMRFKVDYNRNKADGFVYDIEVKPGYVGGADSWLPLESTQLYNVATNSKLADGGAGYDAFDAITNGKRILDYTDAELFAKYAEKECELDGAPYSTLKFDGLDTMLAQDVYQCLEDDGLCKCGFC